MLTRCGTMKANLFALAFIAFMILQFCVSGNVTAEESAANANDPAGKGLGESSVTYRIPWWVMDTGGVTATGRSYQLFAMAGQTAIGQSQGQNGQLSSGFWTLSGFVTAVEDGEEILPPDTYELKQNYPNPFNPTTTIAYSLPKTGHVSLEIYNLLGQRVKVLVNETETAGYRTVSWNGRDSQDREVNSGLYFYRIVVEPLQDTSGPETGTFSQSCKMLFLK